METVYIIRAGKSHRPNVGCAIPPVPPGGGAKISAMTTAPGLPLLTSTEIELLLKARRSGRDTVECSLDLGLSATQVAVGGVDWAWQAARFPYPERFKTRTIYYWDGGEFKAAARYGGALIKLIPTAWGVPTFEIDGIKMLPSAHVSPYADAERKVALVEPRGKVILDTCGGLGYFAAWCLRGGAARILSFERSADVMWLRGLNPWSPGLHPTLNLTVADVVPAVSDLPAGSIDAVLHDPPRFGIAGELYAGSFYEALARVLRPKGRLFHYTGRPNALTSGRDVPREVAKRLEACGFRVTRVGDGLLGVKR
jgi:predicted methyltransferase